MHKFIINYVKKMSWNGFYIPNFNINIKLLMKTVEFILFLGGPSLFVTHCILKISLSDLYVYY
jgi:hypothetical protein